MGAVLEADAQREGTMRKRLVAGILGALMGLSVAGPARAADLPQEHSGMVLCIGKIVNLPLIDIPDEPIEVGLFISDDFKCVRERIG
jgi:hypothetical protein